MTNGWFLSTLGNYAVRWEAEMHTVHIDVKRWDGYPRWQVSTADDTGRQRIFTSRANDRHMHLPLNWEWA